VSQVFRFRDCVVLDVEGDAEGDAEVEVEVEVDGDGRSLSWKAAR